MSRLLKCYAERYYAECSYAECHYAEYGYAGCHYAECGYADCYYAKCGYAGCHVTEHPVLKNSSGYFKEFEKKFEAIFHGFFKLSANFYFWEAVQFLFQSERGIFLRRQNFFVDV